MQAASARGNKKQKREYGDAAGALGEGGPGVGSQPQVSLPNPSPSLATSLSSRVAGKKEEIRERNRLASLKQPLRWFETLKTKWNE